MARAAMGLLSLFLLVVAEHFPQSSLLTFVYSHLRKYEASHMCVCVCGGGGCGKKERFQVFIKLHRSS